MTETKPYRLTDIERKELQKCLLGIYNDVAVVCDKYNLQLMLGGGSCLGAVRHQGFIPWDDDLDLIMFRKDYNKLLDLFEHELADRYDLVEPGKTRNGNKLFAKIMKKNTTYIEKGTHDKNTPTGIFIDIFPIELLPDHKLNRMIFLFLANIFTRTISIISSYQSDKNTSVLLYHKIIGKLASIISFYNWHKIYVSFISSSNGNTFCTIPSGRKGVYGEIQSVETFFPVTNGIFEGVNIRLPNQYDKYLTSLYGNYMQLPPIEQQNYVHEIIKLEF